MRSWSNVFRHRDIQKKVVEAELETLRCFLLVISGRSEMVEIYE